MELCVNNLFPCPLNLTPDLDNSFLNVTVNPMYSSNGIDLLPNKGMVHTSTVAVVDEYPINSQDPVVTVSDPSNDCLPQPCIDGDEITRLSGFLHEDENFSFELQLETYSLEDMAAYHLLLDLDDNNTTGMVVTNG